VISVASRAAFSVPVSGTTGKRLCAKGDHTFGEANGGDDRNCVQVRYGRIGA
jgi:hypothetical protein